MANLTKGSLGLIWNSCKNTINFSRNLRILGAIEWNCSKGWIKDWISYNMIGSWGELLLWEDRVLFYSFSKCKKNNNKISR